jgi:cell division septation protein DedD
VADPATNSLVVFATAQEFQNIREVLKKLDLVPRQVLMEVLVAEITLTDDLAFGIEYAIRRKGSAATVNPSLEGKVNLLGTLPATFPSGLTSIITSGQDFKAVINALMQDSKVKVLSNPSVLAVDNRPARIQVGSEEPIATGTTTAQVGTVAQSISIQYRNLGRILTIIPQVNSQGLVHLQVKVEVSERGSLVRIGQDDFSSFTTRDAETTAVVQDGDTLVIGGIINERISQSRTGIPFLMDIPMLGQFFRVDTDDVDRTELVILITPHVIRNRNEAKNVTDKYIDSLATVRLELEKLKRQKEREKAVSKESPLVIPDKESGLVPREGSYVVPQKLPRAPKSPIKGINFASRVNGGASQFVPESVEEMTESTIDPDEYASTEGPEIDFGEIWRVLLKIFTFGLLGGEEEGDAPKVSSKVSSEVFGGRVGKAYEGREELKDKIIAAEKVKRATPRQPARNVSSAEKTATSTFTEREPLVAEGIVGSSQKAGKARPERAEFITDIKITPAQKAREVWVESSNGTEEGAWTVQVKAFSRESNARSLAKELQNKGYDAYVVAARVNGPLWYRVRIGHMADVKEAKKLHETLKMKERYSQAYLTSR